MKYIYKITCLKNDKVYIGQSNKPQWRWYQHKHAAKEIDKYGYENSQLISRAIHKYGEENFTFEVIVSCLTDDIYEINDTERKLIAFYDACNMKKGYNIDPGGRACISQTPEVREKISVALKKWHQNNVHHFKGKKFSEEHKRNISIASMGKPGTNLGKKFSEEWKHKIGTSQPKENLKNRRFSEKEEGEICEKYKNGSSGYSLANQYDCYRSLIHDILLRKNIILRLSNDKSNVRMLKSVENEIDRLYKENNLSISSISKKVNVPRTSVRNCLIRLKYLKA